MEACAEAGVRCRALYRDEACHKTLASFFCPLSEDPADKQGALLHEVRPWICDASLHRLWSFPRSPPKWQLVSVRCRALYRNEACLRTLALFFPPPVRGPCRRAGRPCARGEPMAGTGLSRLPVEKSWLTAALQALQQA